MKFFVFKILTTITILQSTFCWGIDPLQFGALPEVQLVAISPSGKLLAYRKVGDTADQIAVMSLTERKLVFAVTLDDLNPFSLKFINEELVYLRASENKKLTEYSHNRFELSSGYILNLNTRKAHQILKPGEDVYPAQTGLGRIVGMLPDNKTALMPAYVGQSGDVPTYDLLKVDLTKHTSVASAHKGRDITRDYFVNESGDILAIEEFGEKRDRHNIMSKKNGKFEQIYKEKTEIPTKNIVGLTEDNKNLVMLMTDTKTKNDNYYQLSLNDGAISGPLFDKKGTDVAGVVTNSNRQVKGIIYDGFSPGYTFFDPKLNARFAQIAAKFPEQSIVVQDYTNDFKYLVIYVEGPNYAGDYFLSEEGKDPVYLVSARPKVPTEAINPIGKITLTARDGLKIPTLLTIPAANVKNMKNLPAILLPHGGPEAHDVIGFDWLAQAFASQGFLVIQPQFRGSSGFGLDHSLAGRGQWGKKMQDDLTDSVNALAQKGFIDAKKVCIVGASYGGYAALAGAAFTPDLYRCAVSINGVSDLNKMLRVDRFKYGKESSIVAYWERQLGQGEIDNNDLDAISPINFAAKIKIPLLLLHSDKDVIVDPGQSTKMKSALAKEKKPVDIIELTGDDHYLSKFPTRKKALEETLSFVNKHLK